jgi:hypothetical protein
MFLFFVRLLNSTYSLFFVRLLNSTYSISKISVLMTLSLSLSNDLLKIWLALSLIFELRP